MSGGFVHSHPKGSQPIASSSKPRQGSKLKHTLAVASASPGGKRKRSRADDNNADDDDDDDDDDNDDDDDGEDEDGVDAEVEGDVEMDTDDEISAAKEGKSTKKHKTKRKPPTTASTFGATLTSLLADPAPSSSTKSSSTSSPSSKPKKTSQPILSLSRAPLPPSKAQVNLERKAARVIKQEKAEREDRARIRDVIEGWAPAPPVVAGVEQVGSQEFEKALRKTAQRGVIKLFNAILSASKAAEEQDISMSARAGVKAEQGKRKEKDNVLGRGAREELTKESFLELVKKGGR